MIHSAEAKKERHYIVQANSKTGHAVAEYFNRCQECEDAARDLLMTLPNDYAYPPITDDTDYIGHVNLNLDPDVEAGGLSMIISPATDPSASTAGITLPDHRLWRTYTDEDGTTYHLPRMIRERKYVPITKARQIEKSPEKICWEFKHEPDGRFVAIPYDKASRTMLPADKAALRSILKKPIIPPQFKLAIAYHYSLVFDDIADADTDPKSLMDKMGITPNAIQKARQLRDAFDSLPTVPNGTLARVLSLTLPEGMRLRNARLEYELQDNGDLHITTNLETNNPELILQLVGSIDSFANIPS